MVTYEIDLSVDADYMYSAPAMKQYDSESRQLRMRLFDRSGENIATKSGQKYRMRGLKPDGQPIYVKAETEGEHVVYTLDPQVLTAVGTVLMDVEILKADDESFLLSSQLIAIEVEPAALSHEKLKSDSVITAIAGIGADTIASERVIAAIAEKARKQEKLLDGIEATEKARQQAEEGRVTAEGKRAEGESARAAAESGRSTAEEERTKKEEERKGAESSRQEAEATRAEAERQRIESEKVRTGAEDTRANAESTRAAAESSRLDAEKARETAEEGRKTAESSRVDAESRRSDAETKRATAEDARADAEKARAIAESLRANAESTRAQGETTRQGQETGRKDAEEKRVVAESARASSEQERAGSESERKAAEVLRKSAESERAEAEAKRQEAESTRKDAEKARASAEALREESEKLRANAESSRVSEHATSHQTATEDHAKILAVLDTIKKLETGEIVAKVAELESKGATKEYVRAQISALIDGAPQDLDTLKELADALKARGDTEEILTKLGSKIDRTQLDEELKQLDSKLTNLIGSKAAQSDLTSGLAGKVNNADFDTYKSEATKAIADKVSASSFSAYKDEVAKAMTGKVPTTDFDAYKEEASKLIASKAGAAELATLKQQVGDDLQAKINSKVSTKDYDAYKAEIEQKIVQATASCAGGHTGGAGEGGSGSYTPNYTDVKLAEFSPSKSIAPISVAGAENLAAKIIDSLPRPCLTGEDTLKFAETNDQLLHSKTPDGCIFPNGKIVSANDMLSTFCTLWGVTASLLQGCEYRADDINALMDALTCPDFNGLALDQNHAIFLGRFGEILVRVIDALIRSGAFASRLGVLDDIRQIRKLKEDLEIAKSDQAYLFATHYNYLATRIVSVRGAGNKVDKKANKSILDIVYSDGLFRAPNEKFFSSTLDGLKYPDDTGDGKKTRELLAKWKILIGQGSVSFPQLVFLVVFDAFINTPPEALDGFHAALDARGFGFLTHAINVSRANMAYQFYGRPANWIVGLLGGVLGAMVRFVLSRRPNNQTKYFNKMIDCLCDFLAPFFSMARKSTEPNTAAAKFLTRLTKMVIASARNALEVESLTKRDPYVNDILLTWDESLPFIEKYAHALVRGNYLSDDLSSEHEPDAR